MDYLISPLKFAIVSQLLKNHRSNTQNLTQTHTIMSTSNKTSAASAVKMGGNAHVGAQVGAAPGSAGAGLSEKQKNMDHFVETLKLLSTTSTPEAVKGKTTKTLSPLVCTTIVGFGLEECVRIATGPQPVDPTDMSSSLRLGLWTTAQRWHRDLGTVEDVQPIMWAHTMATYNKYVAEPERLAKEAREAQRQREYAEARRRAREKAAAKSKSFFDGLERRGVDVNGVISRQKAESERRAAGATRSPEQIAAFMKWWELNSPRFKTGPLDSSSEVFGPKILSGPHAAATTAWLSRDQLRAFLEMLRTVSPSVARTWSVEMKMLPMADGKHWKTGFMADNATPAGRGLCTYGNLQTKTDNRSTQVLGFEFLPGGELVATTDSAWRSWFTIPYTHKGHNFKPFVEEYNGHPVGKIVNTVWVVPPEGEWIESVSVTVRGQDGNVKVTTFQVSAVRSPNWEPKLADLLNPDKAKLQRQLEEAKVRQAAERAAKAAAAKEAGLRRHREKQEAERRAEPVPVPAAPKGVFDDAKRKLASCMASGEISLEEFQAKMQMLKSME